MNNASMSFQAYWMPKHYSHSSGSLLRKDLKLEINHGPPIFSLQAKETDNGRIGTVLQVIIIGLQCAAELCLNFETGS